MKINLLRQRQGELNYDQSKDRTKHLEHVQKYLDQGYKYIGFLWSNELDDI